VTGRRVAVGDTVPPWRLSCVSPARMRLLAAILRDPNPIHWDHREVAARGLGDRLVNQGPTNVGYVCNALLAWAGRDALRRLTVRFTSNVFDGDEVVASGEVTGVRDEAGETLVTCRVWLDRGDGTRAVDGEAVIVFADDPSHERPNGTRTEPGAMHPDHDRTTREPT
jgi:acyl dehydratase